MRRLIALCLCMQLLAACAPDSPARPDPAPGGLAAASPEPAESAAPTDAPAETPTPLPPDFWQTLPVVPTAISERMRQVYQLGQELGSDPHSFAKIGDCSSAPPYFLTGFERPDGYRLGDHSYLQPVVDYFQGSFGRVSVAAKAGLNTSGILTTLWTDERCLANESLLACEYRLTRPSFAFISMGTNEAYYVRRDPASFERNLRRILDDTLAGGIIPILVSKADNVEGDNSINPVIARLALEYEVPFWNFWAATYPLPDHGLVDRDHLSTYTFTTFTDFSDPRNLQYGMQVRNLTALQVLYLLIQQLAGEALPEPPTATP
jgi:hypothetical protein